MDDRASRRDASGPRPRRELVGLGALLVGIAAWLAYAAHLVSGASDPRLKLILLVAITVGAGLACALAGRGSVRVRVPWLLLSAAIVAYGTSAVSYSVVLDAADRFPSAYDLGLFLFYPLAFAALVWFVRSRVVEFSGALWLDSVVAALAAMALGTAAVRPELESAVTVGQFLYLLGDLGFLGLLLAAWALSGWRGDKSLLLLAVATAAICVGDGVYVTEVSRGTGEPGLLSLLLWPGSLLIFAAGAFERAGSLPSAASSWAKVLIPAVSACACLPIVSLTGRASPAHWISAAGLAFISVRTALTLAENVRLLAAAQHSALTDPLTGLPNRRLLLDRLGQALARQTRTGKALAVLFVDLDDFKTINDGLGHEVGDEVLLRVAQRLSSAIRREDTVARVGPPEGAPGYAHTVARLGGDEFVVLAEGLADPADATEMADRILDELQAPLVVGEHRLFLEASLGITLGDAGQGRAPIELLRDADIAMYVAKQAGRGRYEIFEDEMHRQIRAREGLARDLRRAVAERQLRLLYQPQIDLSSGRMVGVEALVRWEHPERGLLTPDRFIPLAESTGMIVDIDDWVIREACTQKRAWDEAGLESLAVAVNVSAHRLVTGDLAGTVAAALRDTGGDAARLEIELTETVAVEPDSDAVRAIRRVRELGVQVAIDDFGMGHSALSRLQTFPVDRLKIDKSFVAPLTHGPEGASIAAAMIAMARSLGLLVVAEGVEAPEQLAALMSLGCECAQGYLFSKPVPPAQIARHAQDQADFVGDWTEGIAAPGPSEAESAELVRSLLSELQRLTGLDTTYLTRVDRAREAQHITHSHNTAMLDIPEGLTVDWSDTLCRRALEQGVSYTDDVPSSFPDSEAAAMLGLQTYVTVPVINADGDLAGTLCGASCNRVALGPETLLVMERFAALIAQANGQKAASTANDA